ncbi:hypothetical protein KC867_00005, partial [Candidatus Saccharibacteria bacterium]|nr:hypothetical protein [Candidatus Saccharibacteria bacterium]
MQYHRTRLNIRLMALVALTMSLIIVMNWMASRSVEAAIQTQDVRMVYHAPSSWNMDRYQWLSRAGDIGGNPAAFSPHGQTINNGHFELDPNYLPIPPQYKYQIAPRESGGRVVRVYATVASYNIPDCAINVRARLTGQYGNDGNALRVSYRDHDGQGTLGTSYNGSWPSVDWGEVFGDLHSLASGNMLGNPIYLTASEVNPAMSGFGLSGSIPERNMHFVYGNIPISPADARAGIMLSYAAETVDFLSNAGYFGIG